MLKNTLIIALVIVIIYLYYQNKFQSNTITGATSELKGIGEDLNSNNQNFLTFLRDQLNSANLEELKTKLGEKTLNELLEENEDYETEVDTLTRNKNSLEQDLLAQSNSFQSRIKEKDREVKKLKEDLKDLEKVREKLNSEKQISKGSVERISKLTEQITSLEKQLKKMPGEFPEAENKTELEKTHQEQLRRINLLFDENATNYSEIDFNGLYSLLEKIAEEQKKNSRASIQSETEGKEVNYSLDDFVNWINEDEERKDIFDSIDWNFYRSKKDWVSSLKKWNTLRTDRLDLLNEWINHD